MKDSTASRETIATSELPKMKLQVAGCGHRLELSLREDATVAAIKQAVAESTGLAPAYQRLLFRGKKLDDDDAPLGPAGITDGAKLMLMHSPAYGRDAQAAGAIEQIGREISALEVAGLAPAIAQERCTQLCCRLDAIDVSGSDTLRRLRRAQLRRCETWSGSER